MSRSTVFVPGGGCRLETVDQKEEPQQIVPQEETEQPEDEQADLLAELRGPDTKGENAEESQEEVETMISAQKISEAERLTKRHL